MNRWEDGWVDGRMVTGSLLGANLKMGSNSLVSPQILSQFQKLCWHLL